MAGFPAVVAQAADLVPARVPVAPELRTVVAPPATRDNSIMVFGGLMSTGGFGHTLIFNATNATKPWDNYIVGGAYQRDFGRGWGFTYGLEIGVAGRFGKYELCCDVIVESSGIASSGELWVGGAVRHDGFLLFNHLRIGFGVVFGISAVTKAMGRERERELTHPGASAAVLFYLGPELILSTPAWRDLELVMRLHHRSGAAGTLGKMHDGANAWVWGVRWRF